MPQHLVAIHGVPRSGTSWIGEVVNSSPNVCYKYQPLFSFRHKGLVGEWSTRGEIEEYFARIAVTADEFTDQSERRRSGEFPLFQKCDPTHIVYKEVRYHGLLMNMMRRHERVKLVAVMRCPIAALASWCRAPREFRGDLGWRVGEEWRYAVKKNLNRPEEFNGFERWKDAAWIFTSLARQFASRVHVVKYGSFVKNPGDSSKKLFDFLELDYSAQTREFIEQSTVGAGVERPYSVYRRSGSASDPKAVLGPEIVKEIRADLAGTDLEHYLESAPVE